MSSTEEMPEQEVTVRDSFDFDSLPKGDKPSGQKEEELRLQVYLSHAGISSRRAAEEIINEGRVRVNGKTVRERGHRVGRTDEVTVDGKKIHLVHQKIYLVLNKPEFFVCSAQDDEGRALAQDLLVSYRDVRLFSVGRLDFLSSGLILFTNDGDFANMVAHPRSGIEKEYEVETKKELTDDFLEEFTRGIYFEEERYRIKSYKRLGPRKASLVLTEGKNREIRNACAARRVNIKSLHRVRIGMLRLGTLKPGAYRTLTADELDWFNSQGKVRGEGRSRTEGKSRGEGKPGTGFKPRGEGKPGTGFKPRGEGKPGTGFKPRGEGKSGTGFKRRGEGKSGTGFKPRGEGKPDTGFKPRGEGRPGSEGKTYRGRGN